LTQKQDYFMRLLRQVAETIAAATGLSRAGKEDEGQRILDQEIAGLAGMPVPMLKRLTPESLAAMVSGDRHAMVAELLVARAELVPGDAEWARAVAAVLAPPR
jgi:hypothetical protein